MFFSSLTSFFHAQKSDFLQSQRSGNQESHPANIRDTQGGTGKAPSLESSNHECLEVPEPDMQSMLVAGKELLRRARGAKQCLNMLVMAVHDLAELELVFGRAAAAEAIDEVLTQLTHIAGRNGLAVRTAPDVFTLLMPAISVEALLRALQRTLGKPCCIEFELEGQEILLVPDVMVRPIEDSDSVEGAYRKLCEDIADTRWRRRPRDRDAAGERDSHTPAQELHARVMPTKDIPTFYPPLPATIPIPLGRT